MQVVEIEAIYQNTEVFKYLRFTIKMVDAHRAVTICHCAKRGVWSNV